MPVDCKQHTAEDYAVIRMERGADRSNKLVARARRMIGAPRRYYAAGPVQILGFVFPEPHS